MRTSTLVWIVVVIVAIAGLLWWAMQGPSAGPTSTTPTEHTPSPAPTLAIGSSTLGSILTDPSGMTLYTFTKDRLGTTTCYGLCATQWPPLTIASPTSLVAPTSATGTLSTITRTDGTMQVAYNGFPLYYYYLDTAPGNAKGQNVGHVWFVAKP